MSEDNPFLDCYQTISVEERIRRQLLDKMEAISDNDELILFCENILQTDLLPCLLSKASFQVVIESFNSSNEDDCMDRYKVYTYIFILLHSQCQTNDISPFQLDLQSAIVSPLFRHVARDLSTLMSKLLSQNGMEKLEPAALDSWQRLAFVLTRLLYHLNKLGKFGTETLELYDDKFIHNLLDVIENRRDGIYEMFQESFLLLLVKRPPFPYHSWTHQPASL